MNDHAVDAMTYAWLVMKEKEENKMEGIFLGKIDHTEFDPSRISLAFRTKHLDQHVEVRKELDYDRDYILVEADDVIKTNDELLTLREEVKQWDDECKDWKARYAKANNELFQKGLAYGLLEKEYKNEKAAGEMLLKDRDSLKEKVEKLEAELTEVKTARTLREAYVTGVEKGCESLREERTNLKNENQALKDKLADAKKEESERVKRLTDCGIYWHNRFTSVMTDFGKILGANGVKFSVKEIDEDGNWNVAIDIPELAEAKKKIEDLETKLAAAKSNEAYWRDRKEEEEDHHYYWYHTFDRAVKKAAEKGVHIGIRDNDEECNAGIVAISNMRAEELEKQVVQMEDANQMADTNKSLKQKIGAAEEELKKVDNYWKDRYDGLAECWTNTYKELMAAGKKVGVKIDIKEKQPDSNTCLVYVTNEKAIELAYKLNNTRQQHDKKWQAMTDALKDKGVEVIYMGEEDGKPIVDVKIPGWEIDKRWARDFAKQYTDIKADNLGLEKKLEAATNEIYILRKEHVVNSQRIGDLNAEIDKLKKDRDYWKDRFGSVVTDFTKTLAANGIRFTLKAIDGDGNWDVNFDIPGANELKAENERLKVKADDLFKERGVLQAKLVKRGAELECVKSENSELKKDLKAANKQLDSMDADIDALKNKNRDLEKELAESKTFAEAEYKWNSDGSFTATYTKHDGTKEVKIV